MFVIYFTKKNTLRKFGPRPGVQKKNFSYRISHKNSLTLFPGETFKAVENVRLFIQGYFLKYVNNKCIVTKNFIKTKKNASN